MAMSSEAQKGRLMEKKSAMKKVMTASQMERKMGRQAKNKFRNCLTMAFYHYKDIHEDIYSRIYIV